MLVPPEMVWIACKQIDCAWDHGAMQQGAFARAAQAPRGLKTTLEKLSCGRFVNVSPAFRRPSATRSQAGDNLSSDRSTSDAWFEDQLGQLRAMLAGKADAQGLLALQAVVARKAESDDLHRLQSSMRSAAGGGSHATRLDYGNG